MNGRTWDAIVIGAGAAGMMCAVEAGKRGRRVLVLEKKQAEALRAQQLPTTEPEGIPTGPYLHEQDTVGTDLKNTTLKARGRHDPCVLPRAVPIVEAMTALVLADAFLEKFGGDSEKEVRRNYRSYLKYVGGF